MTHARSCPERAPLVPQRVDRRLGPDLIRRVVSEFADGMSSTRLASRYGIGKGTVLRLIREKGITVRNRGQRSVRP